MKIFNLQIKEDSLDAWAKLTDDLAKVAILAIIPTFFAEQNLINQIISSVSLSIVALFQLSLGLILRNAKLKLQQEEKENE